MTSWTACSWTFLQESIAGGIADCLHNRPPLSQVVGGQYCGNGLLEPGEECDCGPPKYCLSNPCCNATTCTLTRGSQCGSGRCCNLTACTFKPAATPCRGMQGECDLAEYCDGRSNSCPTNVWIADGLPCRGDKVKHHANA